MNSSDVKMLSRDGGCTEQEYEFIRDQVARADRSLVFGLGHDSLFYLENARPGSEIVFVEDDPKWIDRICPKLDKSKGVYKVLQATYATTVKLFEKEVKKNIVPGFLPYLSNPGDFDFIFVDAPKGCSPNHPGRLESIYAAAFLGERDGVMVMVHDTDRYLEQECCRRFLQPPSRYKMEMEEMGRSWVYQL